MVFHTIWTRRKLTRKEITVMLMTNFVELSNNELITALEDAIKTGWQYLRSDLMSWIPVLNRFDTYLEGVIK